MLSLPRESTYSASLSTVACSTPWLKRWCDTSTQNGVSCSARLTNTRPSQPYVTMWLPACRMWNRLTWCPLTSISVMFRFSCQERDINTESLDNKLELFCSGGPKGGGRYPPRNTRMNPPSPPLNLRFYSNTVVLLVLTYCRSLSITAPL